METAKEIKEFLMTRRAKITPDQVGLASSGRRRVPGLRREEVALLAGVSAEYYIQVEQGACLVLSRPGQPFDGVSGRAAGGAHEFRERAVHEATEEALALGVPASLYGPGLRRELGLGDTSDYRRSMALEVSVATRATVAASTGAACANWRTTTFTRPNAQAPHDRRTGPGDHVGPVQDLDG